MQRFLLRISLFLTVLMSSMFLSGVTLSASTLAGQGTEGSPYQLRTMEDIYEIPKDMSAHYILMNDIDMFKITKEPMEGDFKGVLDGNGYSIKNMRIIGNKMYTGLFSKSYGATFKNLIIDSASVSINGTDSCTATLVGTSTLTNFINCSVINSGISGWNSVGGLAGRVSNSGIVENCKGINNTIYAHDAVGGLFGGYDPTSIDPNPVVNCYTEGGSINMIANNMGNGVGGLIGWSVSGITVNRCHSTTPIKGKPQNSGGLIGNVGKKVVITECYTTNNIEGYSNLGGIIGELYNTGSSTPHDILIENCYSTSNITATQGAGGLAAVTNGTVLNIKNSYYAGKVTNTNEAKKANPIAILGTTITYSYFDMTLSKIYSPANQARETNLMYKKINYTGWDFENVWWIDNDKDYPKLRYTLAEPEPEKVYVESISLEPGKLTIPAGERRTIVPVFTPSNATNKKIQWISSNPCSFTISDEGVVHAISSGFGTVIAITADGHKTAYCNIMVTEEPSVIQPDGIILSPKKLELNVSDTYTLSATVTPSNAANKNVSWQSNNNSVVSVNANGEIIALSSGTATITAAIEGTNLKDTCVVTVKSSSSESENLALKATATSNSSLNPNRAPSKVNDGDMETNWIAATGATDVYLVLEFANQINFSKIIINENGSRINDYSIQKWNGTTWEDIYTGRSIGTDCNINFSTSITTNKIRINFLTMTNANAPSIKEIEVYK